MWDVFGAYIHVCSWKIAPLFWKRLEWQYSVRKYPLRNLKLGFSSLGILVQTKPSHWKTNHSRFVSLPKARISASLHWMSSCLGCQDWSTQLLKVILLSRRIFLMTTLFSKLFSISYKLRKSFYVAEEGSCLFLRLVKVIHVAMYPGYPAWNTTAPGLWNVPNVNKTYKI